MHALMVVGQIVGIGGLVHILLVPVHVLEVLKVVGILHRHAVLGLGEIDKDAVTIWFGISHLPIAHEHHIHAVKDVQAVGVVGVEFQQLAVLIGSGVIVLHLVLEDGAHVVETLLDNLVGRGDFLLGLGNLFQVVFLKVRIFGAFQGFNIHLDGVAVLINHNAVG